MTTILDTKKMKTIKMLVNLTGGNFTGITSYAPANCNSNESKFEKNLFYFAR